jgi:hypothetical protein
MQDLDTSLLHLTKQTSRKVVKPTICLADRLVSERS